MSKSKNCKRGDKINHKGTIYTIAFLSLNYVFLTDENGKEIKLSYDKIKVIDETTHN